jgi:hypothetical protein
MLIAVFNCFLFYSRILHFCFVVTGLSLKKNYAFISIQAQQERPIRSAVL